MSLTEFYREYKTKKQMLYQIHPSAALACAPKLYLDRLRRILAELGEGNLSEETQILMENYSAMDRMVKALSPFGLIPDLWLKPETADEYSLSPTLFRDCSALVHCEDTGTRLSGSFEFVMEHIRRLHGNMEDFSLEGDALVFQGSIQIIDTSDKWNPSKKEVAVTIRVIPTDRDSFLRRLNGNRSQS